MKRLIVFLAFIIVFSFVHATCLENQIDINIATIEELDKLNGIGPAYAQRIIDARPFISIEELTKVSGIGPATLTKIKDQGLACISLDNLEESSEDETKEIEEETLENFVEENNEPISLTPIKINLNIASAKELERITGIGKATAELIIDTRPFCSLEDLLKIKGIGPAKLDSIRNQDIAFVEPCEIESELELESEQEIIEEIKETSQTEEQKPTENVINLSRQQKSQEIITGKVIYQSKTEVIRRYALPAFSVLLVVIIFLILKN